MASKGVTVNRKALAEALAVAMTGAASRGLKPHLEYVLLHGTESVLPKTGTQRLRWRTNVGAFLSAVRQARVCTSEESGGIAWEWDDRGLSLQSQAAEIGQGDITLYLGAYRGTTKPDLPMRVTLDGEYCQQILTAMDKDADVDVVAIDGESAVKFESGEITTIIMPMSKE